MRCAGAVSAVSAVSICLTTLYLDAGSPRWKAFVPTDTQSLETRAPRHEPKRRLAGAVSTAATPEGTSIPKMTDGIPEVPNIRPVPAVVLAPATVHFGLGPTIDAHSGTTFEKTPRGALADGKTPSSPVHRTSDVAASGAALPAAENPGSRSLFFPGAASAHASVVTAQDFTTAEGGLDPNAPGNSVALGNVRVSVEAYTVAEDEVALDMVIEKAAGGAPATFNRSTDPRQLLEGFSYEEELFRMKWGWAAFDTTRRIAAGMDSTAR